MVAVAGGVVLIAMSMLTVYSVIARWLAGSAFRDLPPATWLGPLLGDFELMELGVATTVLAALPYCQMVRGHVAVDLLAARLPPRLSGWLAVAGDLLFTAIAGLLAWRATLGAADIRAAGQTSMILGLPSWWGYAVSAICLMLLTVVCAYTTVVGVRDPRARASSNGFEEPT